MFGVGGGIIIVPLLIALAAYPPKTAMATSLAAILFTATAAAASHANEGNVAWAEAVLIGVPAVFGALLGAAFHQRRPPAASSWPSPSSWPWSHLRLATDVEHLLAALLGVVAGTLSAMFGVGGGLIFVPTLIFLGSNTHQAVATSLAAMIPAILVGSWRQTRYGAVRWRDATVIGIASIPTA